MNYKDYCNKPKCVKAKLIKYPKCFGVRVFVGRYDFWVLASEAYYKTKKEAEKVLYNIEHPIAPRWHKGGKPAPQSGLRAGFDTQAAYMSYLMSVSLHPSRIRKRLKINE